MAFSRWVSLLLVPLFLLNPISSSKMPLAQLQPASITLQVDVFEDFNDLAHQACNSSVAGDCSLRGAITRANRYPGNVYVIQLSEGTYNLSLVGDDDTNECW